MIRLALTALTLAVLAAVAVWSLVAADACYSDLREAGASGPGAFIACYG